MKKINIDEYGSSEEDFFAEDNLKELVDYKKSLDLTAIVAITDAKGVIIHVNEKFTEISKYSKGELLGKTHSILKSGYHPQSYYKEMWDTIRQGNIWKGEVLNKAKDGSYYWVDTTIIPFLDETGHPYQYLAVRFDITGMKIAIEKNEIAQIRMAQSNKLSALTELMAFASHKINNPISIAKGLTSKAIKGIDLSVKENLQIQNCLEKINIQLDRVAESVKDMRNITGENKRDIVCLLDLSGVIENLEKYCEFKCQNAGVEISYQCDETVWVSGRYISIIHILNNLVNFAIHSNNGIANAWIAIKVLTVNNRVEIHITDSSPLLSEDEGRKILLPFFYKTVRDPRESIDLLIAKELVNEMGGELKYLASSTYKTFVISFNKHN